jgi:predicted ATP-grasp superfamily ATP-dependent carboligase
MSHLLMNSTLRTPAHAIVLDGNQRSALASVRSLGRREVPVLVGEAHGRSLAAASRFCTASLIYPDPAKSPAAFVEWLQEIGRRYPGAILMPMTDLTVPLVLQAQPHLQELRTALPSLQSYDSASDKLRLFELAQAAGVRVPQTAVISRTTAAALGDRSFRYPVVVKPRHSSVRLATGVVKRTVRYAHNLGDLRRIASEQLVDDTDELLLQEYVTGFGAGVFGLYERGHPTFFFAHRRLREKPPSGGVSVLCESVAASAEGMDAARRILDPLAWHGVAMVEFKVDAQGRWWLIEINARFWGSLQLAVDCGADFPWFVYQLAAGNKLDVPATYACGKQLRWWLGDLDNLYAQLKSREWTPTLQAKIAALATFAWPWRPGMKYEFLRWNDPAPASAAFSQYFQSLLGSRK